MIRIVKPTIRGISVLALLTAGFIGMSSPASAASCQQDYEIIFKMMNGTTHPRAQYCNYNCNVPKRVVTDAEVSYALDCEKLIKGKSVKANSAAHKPLGLRNASSPSNNSNSAGQSRNFADDLGRGLEEWNRKAACMTQQYKCTYIGNGQESCTWVTVSIC